MSTTELIDAILQERGMSRRQLAIAAGIPTSSFQAAMARGKNITVEMLISVAKALEVDPYSIMDFDTATKALEKEIDTKSVHTLTNAFNRLNAAGQAEAVKRVEELTEIPKYQKEK